MAILRKGLFLYKHVIGLRFWISEKSVRKFVEYTHTVSSKIARM